MFERNAWEECEGVVVVSRNYLYDEEAPMPPKTSNQNLFVENTNVSEQVHSGCERRGESGRFGSGEADCQ